MTGVSFFAPCKTDAQNGYNYSTDIPTWDDRPLSVVYFDRVTGTCLALNVYEVGEMPTRYEERLIKLVKRNPDRFVELPYFTKHENWYIMAQFAEELGEEDLLEALDADDYPDSEFEKVAAQLGLYEAWHDYRKKFFRRVFQKWTDRNGITNFHVEF